MKKILLETIFIMLFFALILGMIGIAELLTQIITMNTIKAITYIAIVFSVLYIVKN